MVPEGGGPNVAGLVRRVLVVVAVGGGGGVARAPVGRDLALREAPLRPRRRRRRQAGDAQPQHPQASPRIRPLGAQRPRSGLHHGLRGGDGILRGGHVSGLGGRFLIDLGGGGVLEYSGGRGEEPQDPRHIVGIVTVQHLLG